MTFGTALRPSHAPRFHPPVPAIAAHEGPFGIDHFVISAFNIDGLSVDQSICNHFPSLLNNPSESRPRNIHMTPGVFMRHADKIGKSYCLSFIHRKTNLGQITHGNASGLEIINVRIERHHAMFFGSRHKRPSPSEFISNRSNTIP